MAIASILWRSNKVLCSFDLKRWAGPVRAFCSSLQADYVIGIDFGTTNSRVVLLEGKVPTIIESESGRAMPSYVALDSEKNILVGLSAKNHAMTYPESSFFRMKHLIGKRHDDPRIQKLVGMVPYRILCASNGEAKVEAETKDLSATEVCAHLFTKMKETAERYLMKNVSKAVIAVPMYFDDAQRKHIQAAGRMAGLDVLKVIDEPIAAVIPSFQSLNNGVVAVLDLGGGTFDISILKISNGTAHVIARNGDEFLGGEDIDDALVEHFVYKIKTTYYCDITGDRMAMMRLKDAVEKAKVELSSALEAKIYIDYIGGNIYSPIHVDFTLTRSEFEAIVHYLIGKIRIPCNKCLIEAGISAQGVTEVFLVGGMSKVPLLQQVVVEIFRKAPTVGAEADEAVAVGAAIQGGIIIEDNKEPQLPNIISLSIGIETLGGIFTRIIERNSKIPFEASYNFTTESDNQESVLLRIFQGEREMASDNKLLGELELRGILPAPHSVPRIVVTFYVDVDDLLTVCARNKDTGKRSIVQIGSSIKVSEEDTKKVVKEALLHAMRDMAKVELIEARNMVLITITRIEKLLLVRENDNVDPFIISHAKTALADLKDVVDSGNASLMRAKYYVGRSSGTDLARWKPHTERGDMY